MSDESWSRGDRFGALAAIPVLAFGVLAIAPTLRGTDHGTGCRPMISLTKFQDKPRHGCALL